MKRDLQLFKKILLKIEDEYTNFAITNLKIDGYTMSQIANHCEILYNEGLLSKYKGSYASDELHSFAVGNLTNEGFNYLDMIRDTDDLESYKHFNFYQDNSVNIGNGNKFLRSGIATGGENNGKE